MRAKVNKKRTISFSREHKFMVVLVAFLIIDIITHFSHPAYKYYRNLSKRLDTENTNFRKKIVSDFVPVLALVASNNMVKVSSSPIRSTTSDDSPTKPLKDKDSFRSSSLPRGSNFFTVAGVPHINISGFVYSVGDYFDGSPILFLNPICMETRNGRYQIVSDFRPFDSQQTTPQIKDITE